MAKKYVLKEFKVDRLSKTPQPIKGEKIGMKDQKRLEKGRTIPLRVDTLNNKSVNPRGYFLLQVILRWRNSSYFVTTKNQIVI